MSTYCQNCGILRMSNVAYCHACVEAELAGRDTEIERLREAVLGLWDLRHIGCVPPAEIIEVMQICRQKKKEEVKYERP